MNNYKIRVNNEAESREAQELFKQLGFKLVECHRVGMVAVNDGEIYPDVIGNWDEYEGEELTLPQLRDLVAKSKSNEQGMISGANALRAIADGENVECFDTRDTFKELDWCDASGMQAWLFLVEDNPYKFRLKPRTVKLEIEVPAPFEPKDGDECFILSSDSEDGFYRFVYEENSGFHKNLIQFGVWRTVADIKIVVDQLRKLKEQSK